MVARNRHERSLTRYGCDGLESARQTRLPARNDHTPDNNSTPIPSIHLGLLDLIVGLVELSLLALVIAAVVFALMVMAAWCVLFR